MTQMPITVKTLLREETLQDYRNSRKDTDDGSDNAPLPIQAVQTVKGAFELQIAEFAGYQGCEELSSTVMKV